MAEFARVLRPAGHLVISDAHHELVFRGSVVHALTSSGEPGLVATYRHSLGDFFAALPAGFLVRRCEEPRGVRAHDEARVALTVADRGPARDVARLAMVASRRHP